MTAMAGSVELRWGGASDTGRVRSNNQDHYLAREDVGLWAVADGMGGHRGGEIASAVACEAIDQRYASHTVDGLVGAVEAANAAVYRRGSGDPDLAGMGTTIVAIALVDDGRGEPVLAIANVGDSRAYRLAGLELEQLTADHSLVADLVREGSLSPEEAAVHPQRNILTRVLGVYDDVPVDHVTVVPHNGDRYVLCSDGLFNEVPEPAIASVLRRLADPADAAHELVRLANEGGGRDNVTVVVVDVVDDAGRAAAASAALGASGWAGTGAGGTATHPTVVDDEADLDEGRRGRRHNRKSGPRHVAKAAKKQKPRRFTWRVFLFVLLLLGLAAGVVATIQWYGQSTYFVGFEGDRVAIFKGRPGGLLWIEPELVETSELARDRVPEDRVDELQAGVEQSSKSDAEAYVNRVSERAEQLSPTSTTTTRPPATTTTTRATTTTTAATPPPTPAPA